MYNLFKTDYYQLSMTVAYILKDRANDRTGFECFVRRVKKETNPLETHYDFNSHESVTYFIKNIQRELESKDYMVNEFLDIVTPRMKEKHVEELRKKWRSLETEFTFNVAPDGIIKPFTPVFQYNGPKWIGQILETSVLNLINGNMGLTTYLKNNKVSKSKEISLRNIVSGHDSEDYKEYIQKIKTRLTDYRHSTNAILLEAGFRRAPGFKISQDVSHLALMYGWDGTSNVSSLEKEVPIEKIGGSCAHAFIMSYENELDAFRDWNDVYPNSTILVDTYNTIDAVDMLIKNNIVPSDVRIDSEPLETLSVQVRRILDDAGWNDVGIFLSGDLTPYRLREMESDGIPIDKCMAGTKLLNLEEMVPINTGLVYKLVEYERDGKIYYPEKKSNGKGSISALKKVVVTSKGYKFEKGFDLSEMKNLEPTMELIK